MIEKTDIDKLFIEICGIFPAWRQSWQDTESIKMAKRQWLKALNENGVTPGQLESGLKKARQFGSDWPPSTGKFLEWCGALSSLPKNIAFQMACMQSDTKPINDPLVLEAARRTGSWDLKNKPERETRPLFFEHYERVLRERDDGAQFRLPAPKPEPVETEKPAMSPEEQKRIMDELRGTLGVSQ